MKLQDVYDWIGTIAQESAQEWFRQQCGNVYGHYYLYFKPSTATAMGELRIAEDAPAPEWELADGKRIGPNGTIEQVQRRIADCAKRLPILAWGGKP